MKRTKAAHRRLAAWILADLVRLAAVQRAGGKKLPAGAWLATAANILSSAPPGLEKSERSAPERFGLDYGSLLIFARRPPGGREGRCRIIRRAPSSRFFRRDVRHASRAASPLGAQRHHSRS
jgi:hypothetical protein